MGDVQFTLQKITGETAFTLAQALSPDHVKLHKINDAHSKEVLPDVFISAGESRQASVASVVIRAPRDVLILRGELRRADPQYKEQA